MIDPIVTRPTRLLLPRRTILKNGLAGLAAAMASRALFGCGDDSGSTPADAGRDGGGPIDAGGGMPDVPIVGDAGPMAFPRRTVPARPALVSRIAEIGPLGDPDANGVRLAAGFSSRIVAVQGQVVAATGYEWHIF